MLSGPRKTVTKARQLRRTMTWPEVILWRRLRQRPGGFKFRRQHPAGAFILDFYCAEARLAIEVDGMAHDMGGRPARDDNRARWLDEQGVATLRFSAGEMTKLPDGVVESIIAACLERGDPLHQLSAGPPPRSGEETL
ncbi:MAG TPA: endonuclease domain-containing protein [Sphingomicrobium sp.]|nr:endonuclease domain-containing protein [Sphingomicrobium sp.]